MDSYYKGCPYDCSEQQRQMDLWYKELCDKTCYERKALTYRGAAELCEVKLFDESPFYYEIISGRARNTSQNGFPPGPGLEGWYMRKQMDLLRPFQEFMAPYEHIDLVWGGVFSDHAHHTVGYENVFRLGFRGIEEEAKAALCRATEPDAVGFYHAVITACQAVKKLGEKFSAAANKRLREGVDAAFHDNMQAIKDTACRIPYEPVKTFYEALCAILFIKELVINVEGVAVAVLGHLDRILLPFYEKDLREGRITYESAKNLMAHFLVHTDGRWDLSNHDFASTNCSLVIGGCDASGNLVCNDITRLILEGYEENGFVNPKIQVRLSQNHPAWLFEQCSRMICNGRNVFSCLNDDVIIQAHVKMGKQLCDARQYSAGGCQEPILDNCEFNSRAFIYISLPQMLNSMLDPSLYALVPNAPTIQEQYDSFDAFYRDYIQRISKLYQILVEQLNEREPDISEFCPLPLLSSTVTGCMERGRDMTRRGAKYNAISMPFVGIGTAIDSLLAIREMVFEKRQLTLSQLNSILAANFEQNARTRAYLVNKCPKYGEDTDSVNQFAAQFFQDIAALSSGQRSPLGAVYEPSLFVFYLFDWMKEHVGATADGRYAHTVLSRGINPPDFSAKSQLPNLLHTVSQLDLTNYPGAAVLYLEMPVSCEQASVEHVTWTIRGFLQAGGSALDLQVLDPEILKKARKDPEAYSNLVVRVCGFSAYYTSLEEKIQDEILQRVFING